MNKIYEDRKKINERYFNYTDLILNITNVFRKPEEEKDVKAS